MKRILIWLAVVALVFVVLFTSHQKPENPLPQTVSGELPEQFGDSTLTFVFYNVENLFDIHDDPEKNDQEFLPGSKKQWTAERYQQKLADLSRVLAETGGDELPEIVGLCEVENRQVVEELFSTGPLQAGGYAVVHVESRDARGIDVSFAYRPDELKVLENRTVSVRKGNRKLTTRDILLVTGLAGNGERFHIFINHWPSRVGGEAESEPDRIAAAAALRMVVDSLQQADPEAHIVIMGDMNDEPGNRSLRETLAAGSPETNPSSGLVNLMLPAFQRGEGSYNYRGDWNMLDNLVVSSSLLDEEGFRCTDREGHIFRREWMEFRNRKGEVSPNRTYAGNKYTGGVSDHFPVYFRLVR